MGSPIRIILISGILLLMGCATGGPTKVTASAKTPTVRTVASDPEKLKARMLMWPMASKKISRGFRPVTSDDRHDGIDLLAPEGTRIYAPADGKVVYSGRKFHGYGNMIIIEHNEKVATLFGHLRKILVKRGERIKRGTLIGLVGHTGRASAPHLHFEVRYLKNPVDPVEYLP